VTKLSTPEVNSVSVVRDILPVWAVAHLASRRLIALTGEDSSTHVRAGASRRGVCLMSATVQTHGRWGLF
jgi:hypothetical protein